MKKMGAFKMLVLTTVFVGIFVALTAAQEFTKYAKDGKFATVAQCLFYFEWYNRWI